MKQKGFEPGPKDSHGRCRGDMFRLFQSRAATTGKARLFYVGHCRVRLKISDEDELKRMGRSKCKPWFASLCLRPTVVVLISVC